MFNETLSHRDKLLKENWYIACQSFRLKDKKALKRTIYDEDLVLFRDENGKAVCFQDRCIHRNAPLSAGEVKCGKIVCPYHGWTYDKSGDLISIPSEKVSCLNTGKRKLSAKEVCEQDGFVWVWMGQNKPEKDHKPWSVPHRNMSEWNHYVMETPFENEVTHLVENFMDVPHTVFVHKGWFRNSAEKEVKIDVETKQGETLVTYHRKDDKIGFIDRLLNPKGKALKHTDRFIMPNITQVDYLFGESSGFSIISQCTPVSTLKTHVYTIISYKIFPADVLLKPFLNWYTRVVINQDVDIMELQGKNLSRFNDVKFMGGVADVVHREIEKLRTTGIENTKGFYNINSFKTAEIWI